MTSLEITERQAWTKIPGNSTEYTYYSGTETNNPSGNANIKEIVYKKNGVTIFTQQYSWDTNDNPIKIETL